MYAIIRTGGKQYRVKPGDVVRVERLDGEIGSSVTLGDVLLVAGEGEPRVGSPLVAGVSVALAVTAALIGDVVWYYIGKIKGGKVLSSLCRISLEPDTCVRKTEDTFARRGAKTLVTAKFVPGLSTIAPPLAGMFGRRSCFDFASGPQALPSAIPH